MNWRVDWEDQRTFLAVLQTGSLSAAARRMGVTQPTMRARIEALEEALGAVLFTRSVRGLTPTAQARTLLPHVEAMARASEAFIRAASAPAGEIAGVVRLSVAEIVGIALLPEMLAPLRAQHPALQLEIELSNAPANVLEQAVDVAVRMVRPHQEGLVAQLACTIPLGLFAHEAYLRRRGKPQSLEALLHHDIIGPDRTWRDLNAVPALQHLVGRARFVVRTDSHPAQLAMARAGLGIAVVQVPLASRDPDLRRLLPAVDLARLETWLVTHQDLHDVPRVHAVFAHLVQAFRTYAGAAAKH